MRWSLVLMLGMLAGCGAEQSNVQVAKASESCAQGAERACGWSMGACIPGTQTCEHGKWGTCQGGVRPTPEICNGLDDNCDGRADESCPERQEGQPRNEPL